MPKHTATKVRKMTNVPLTEGIILAILSAVVGFFAAWLPYKRDRAKDMESTAKDIKKAVDEMSIALVDGQQKRINQLQEHARLSEARMEARYEALVCKYDALVLKYDALRDNYAAFKDKYDKMVDEYERQLKGLRERVAELENDKRGG